MKRILLSLVALSVAMGASAKIKMAPIFADNMVIQQQSDAAIWGYATPKSTVEISASWGGSTASAKADKDGRWNTTIATPEAGGPYTITVSDGEPLTIENVLVGEVWLCSGQSNMKMTMSSTRLPVEGSIDYILGAKKCTPIRVCDITNATANELQEQCKLKWLEHTPTGVANSSATAYFFASYLNRVLDVPVGVIVAAWGGTTIQAWMDEPTLKKYDKEVSLAHLKGGANSLPKHKRGAVLFNAMIAPIVGYNIKGMLWYQGESNALEAELYSRLLPDYIAMMRSRWGMAEMPFYAVQVAPFDYTTIWDSPEYTGALIREAQVKAMAQIPNSALIPLLDLGVEDNIHPAMKREVGERFAYHALVNQYGLPVVEPCAPKYKSHTIEGNRVTVAFDTGKSHLATMTTGIVGFEVAAANRVFYPATYAVTTNNNEVILSSECVEKPVAVRYAFKDYVKTTLCNREGIPVEQFRTDDWAVK